MKERVHNVPLLHVVKQQAIAESLPTIIFLHGFESIKERNVQYAYMLAEKGFRVILPEAIYHGERALKDENLPSLFWKIVLQSIHEIQLIKGWFVDQQLTNVNRIGLAGTSMGAIATLGAMAKYDWVRVAVSLMGDPSYINFANYQLKLLEKQGVTLHYTQEQKDQLMQILQSIQASTYIDTWNARPLLFWHGKQDQVVPYQSSYDFYMKLRNIYEEQNVALSYILDEKSAHNVPNQGVVETVNWFSSHL